MAEMMTEGSDYEEKSRFTGSSQEWLELVKTIMAMANTQGGQIHLANVTCNPALLDSARLDDRVNKVVEPGFHGLRSAALDDTAWVVTVEESVLAPHVLTTEQSYSDSRGRTRSAFHPGQVWVRHSSKTEPASGVDVHRLIQRSASRFLRGIGQAIDKFATRLSEEGGIPVTVASEGLLTLGVGDPNLLFPYTAKTLGKALSKNQNWAAQATLRLGLQETPRYSLPIYGASGKIVVRRYNEAVYEQLRRKLEEQPTYDPWHDD